MKIEILGDILKKGVFLTERASAKSLSLPILNNILIKSTKNIITLTCTDLELAITWQNLADVSKEGEVSIPVKILSSYLNYLTNKKIILEKQNQDLIIISGKNKIKIKGLPPDDFPLIPKIETQENIVLDAKELREKLKQVVDIPIITSSRPEISGVYFLIEGKILKIAATDSFRLGETTIALKENNLTNKKIDFIIPQKNAKEIINCIEEVDDVILFPGKNHILIETKNNQEIQSPKIKIVSRLVEGNYPNYQEIIPKKHTLKITISKSELINQLKGANFHLK